MGEIPLHPIVVHFPIAFYALELVLLLFWRAKKDMAYRRFALFTFWAGYFTMLAAPITGYIEVGSWDKIFQFEPIKRHFLAAASVVIFYTLRAVVWKKIKEGNARDSWIHVAGALIGNALVAITGFFGGLLVYG